MSMRRTPQSFAVLSSASLVILVSSWAQAAPSREECVDAHGRAQEFRERGQIARARQAFLACAQSSCPSLVQQDCARFGEELAQLVPTVTLSARDATGGDLSLTSVYVDDVLVTTRLDDGRAYELEPGKHVLRYVHEGKEVALKVVLNQGERGRNLTASFVDHSPSKSDAADAPVARAAPTRRGAFPLVVAGVGAAAVVTGGVLFGLGSSSVPDACSVSTRECAAPPGASVFAKAESGLRLSNTGLAVGIGGAVALLGGLVWYFAQGSHRDPEDAPSSRHARPTAASPWFTF